MQTNLDYNHAVVGVAGSGMYFGHPDTGHTLILSKTGDVPLFHLDEWPFYVLDTGMSTKEYWLKLGRNISGSDDLRLIGLKVADRINQTLWRGM
jgi:hypothetical protein